MIPVKRQDEPQNFNRDVRIPGSLFLQNNPHPKSKDFDKHAHWSKIGTKLYKLYNGICAYTGMWFSNDKNSANKSSIDHFLPKSEYPQLAYEWSNYRLTTREMNSTKGNTVGIVDPFEVEYDWFILNIETGQIEPNSQLVDDIKNKIDFTIETLRLNYNDEKVQNRFDIINQYKDGTFDFDFLQRRYPYIAYEIKRQGLQPAITAVKE